MSRLQELERALGEPEVAWQKIALSLAKENDDLRAKLDIADEVLNRIHNNSQETWVVSACTEALLEMGKNVAVQVGTEK